MDGFATLIGALVAFVMISMVLAIIAAGLRAVWRFFSGLLAPEGESPRVHPSGPRPEFRPASAPIASPRVPAWTPDPLPSTPLPALPVDSEDLELRVSLGADRGIGRQLTVEIRGGPMPTAAEPLVYVVTGLSFEQGRECPVQCRPTGSMSLRPFSSVHTRTAVARLREGWTVLTFIDLEALYPARAGLQPYVFTCRVHRPGQDPGVGQAEPRGRAMDTATASAHLDLADFGYLDLHAWVKLREDAVTLLVRMVTYCRFEPKLKWEKLSDWVHALCPRSAPPAVQDHVKMGMVRHYTSLRSSPFAAQDRSVEFGREASPDFQRELVGFARELVGGELLDSPARKTYETLRGACWEALCTWVERDKEPLPPPPVCPPARPKTSAPPSPVVPPPPPPPAPAWAPVLQPWEPDPVPVPLRGVDQEKVEQMRAVLSMARVAAVLGFANTTHAQDKILDKFKRRLVAQVPDTATRARVEADLQECLDEATAIIGQLSYFKRRLDAALKPVDLRVRDLLGESMHELIMARAECSADGVALYGYGSRKYRWAPLPVRRPKSSPKPRPAPAVRPAPKPRPAPPPKPAPAVRPAPVRPARPAPGTPPSPSVTGESLSFAELKARVGMPAGLDRPGQIAFIRQQFDRWNSHSLTIRDSGQRLAIAQRLRNLAQLRRLVG